MKIEKKSLPDNKLELTVRVSKTDAQPYLIQTAAHLSTHRPIKGFRPGKAPFEIVKREFGEDAIMREAMEDIINSTLRQAMTTENLDTYGRVDFGLLLATEDDAIAYKATMSLMPSVTLGNWQKEKVKRKEAVISDEELSKALDELATMTVTEQPEDKAAAMGDKAIIDFEVSVDGKVIDSGTATDFPLILGEGRMIPGFEEKVVGAKAGDEVNFIQNFPQDYHAKDLAGKPANFKIKVKQILARIKPEINDEFALRVGVASVEELKNKLKENILSEKRENEEDRVEIEAIKKLTDTAVYSPIPQELIDDTCEELLEEFGHSLAHQRTNLDQYLASVGKTREQVKQDFVPKATQRIKSSLALGKLAEQEKVEISDKEVDEEIRVQKQEHAGHNHNTADYDQPEYRRHVATARINRKLIKLLKEKIVE